MDSLLNALRAAGEPTRLRLMVLLERSELTVSELTHILGQSQPRVSRHLKLLAEAGLVERYREGNWVFYRLLRAGSAAPGSVEGQDLASLTASLVGHVPANDPIILGDLERLEAVRRARADAAAACFRRHADRWGRIRALHLPEEDIEQALLDAVGREPVSALVDFGTGSGRILELLAKGAEHALGVDSSSEMLGLARTNLERAGLRHCEVRQGDIFALPLPPACADLVTIHQVLHFLAEPGRAVEEAARILRPGGRAAIIDFAPHGLEFLREDHGHRRLGFTDGEVEGWLNGAGLALESVRRLPETVTQNAGALEACPARDIDAETSSGAHPSPRLTVCLWLARKGGAAATLSAADINPAAKIRA